MAFLKWYKKFKYLKTLCFINMVKKYQNLNKYIIK